MIRTLLAGTATFLMAAIAVVVVPGAAQAAPCAGSSGVTVLVQYDDGPTQVGCAHGDPETGYDALKDAGFTITYARGSGAGAVCKINDYPASAGCTSMPAANAYWAYFHGRPGGHWTYSTEGGGTYDPAPGTVEGWRFKGNANTPPSSAPPVGAVVTPPKPTKKPTVRPSSGPTHATPTPTASTSATTTPTARPTRGATSTPSGSTSPTASTAPTSTGTPQAFDEPGPVVPAKAEDSGSTSWIWGVVLLGVLAAVGGGVAVRRRRG